MDTSGTLHKKKNIEATPLHLQVSGISHHLIIVVLHWLHISAKDQSAAGYPTSNKKYHPHNDTI